MYYINLKKKAEEHPIVYDEINKTDNLFNGKEGKSVDFVDVGCGYGGLLCII